MYALAHIFEDESINVLHGEADVPHCVALGQNGEVVLNPGGDLCSVVLGPLALDDVAKDCVRHVTKCTVPCTANAYEDGTAGRTLG